MDKCNDPASISQLSKTVQWVCSEKSTNPEVLKMLASDPMIMIRQGVAGNIHTPVEILSHLANDEEKGVRARLATNKLLPMDAQMKLANDTDGYVQFKIAKNPSTSNVALLQLLKNKNTTPEVIEIAVTRLYKDVELDKLPLPEFTKMQVAVERYKHKITT